MGLLDRFFSKRPRVAKVDVARLYKVQSRMSQGSMSQVWKSADPSSGETVAVKVLDAEKLAHLEKRFVGLNKPKEGDIAMRLRHPNVVRTLSHGLTTNDEQFLVMEYLPGVSMTRLIETQSEQLRKYCLRYCVQIGAGLEYLHQNHWIHRDLCPRNIMVTDKNVVKLIDFGLVVPDTPEFRKPGNRTGTANYMAPELIKRRPTDTRIDIFSYAVTCYEMFSGKLPWPASDTLESVVKHLNQPPDDLHKYRPDLNEQVVSVIMKGLEKNPDDRWQTAGEMAAAFQAAKS